MKERLIEYGCKKGIDQYTKNILMHCINEKHLNTLVLSTTCE